MAEIAPAESSFPQLAPLWEANAPSERSGAISEPASEPSTSGTDPEVQKVPTNGYIYHKVSKLDTLAGLAIKYHVTVSDIKRANGILSDNAMFAREHVKIPTGSIPLSEESQVLLARLMSGYGRDASLNAKERKAPGTASITQLPGSPSASRSSYFGSSEAVDDDPGTPYSRRSDKSSSEPGDVELIERTIGEGAAMGYGSDRVRRRTKNDSSSTNNSSSGSRHASSQLGAQQLSQVAEAAVGWLSNAAAAAQAALPAAANGLTSSCLPPVSRHSFNNAAFGEAAGGGGGGQSTWDQLTQAISHGGNSLVEKIRRAASQPALAGGGGFQSAGFGDVADAVLRAPPRSPILKGSNGSSSRRNNDMGSIDLLARGTGLLPPKKDKKGD